MNDGLDLFDHAPDPACLLDADGGLVRANAAFRERFKHRVSARRPPWGRVEPCPFDAGGRRRFEAATPDGRLFEWSERLLEDGRRLAFARDVTDRAAAAAESARAKSLMFAMLTHELRTPLNGILGLAGLLGQEPLTSAQSDHVRAIEESGERLLELISDALDYARLEAGRAQLEAEPFDPVELAQSVAELLAPRARAKGLELVVEAPALSRLVGDANRLRQILFNLVGNAIKFTETGGVQIKLSQRSRGEAEAQLAIAVRDTGPGVPEADRARIFQAFEQADASHSRAFGGAGLGLAIVKRLVDLLDGKVALSAPPGGGALFSVEVRLPVAAASAVPPLRLEGLKVSLAVGSPLLRGALAAAVESFDAQVVREGGVQVFEPDAEPWPEGPAVALLWPDERRAIPALHARNIGYVIKPVRRASLAQQLRAAEDGRLLARPAASAPTATLLAPLLAGQRILLAEDNPLNALIARTALTRAGAVVETAADGEEAIAAARRGDFDVYLLDVRMPVIDGLAAARRIRTLHPAAPIVALTADTGEEERAAALAAGMDAFLTKPISAQRLSEELARLVGGEAQASLPSCEKLATNRA